MAAGARDIGLLRTIANRPAMLLLACFAAFVAPLAGVMTATESEGFLSIVGSLCDAGGVARQVGFPSIAAMWLAMTLMMMMPTALPMMSAYLDIAEAARGKGKSIVPAPVLLLGYMTVWVAFSFAAAGAQMLVNRAAAIGLDTAIVSASTVIVAGLYQFAPLKRACLLKCRSPMPVFLARWTDRAPGIYLLGLEQGASCFGCCWALMLIMFVSGAMNLAWMAGLAIVMLLERMLPDHRAFSHGIGVGLVAAGVAALLFG